VDYARPRGLVGGLYAGAEEVRFLCKVSPTGDPGGETQPLAYVQKYECFILA